jgi:RimJ/RimL family protein N-acetyltransferase
MDLQPTLTGELVILRPTVPDDWAGMYAAASDPLIWELHPARDRWQEPVFRRYLDDALASGGGLTILDRRTGEIIGASRYYGHKPEADEIEIGWTFLTRAYWGGTANREVKRLMLDHIHRYVGCAVFLVGEGNFRSQGAMAKIGGLRRPEMLSREYTTGVHRQIVYEIRRP